MFKYIRKPDSGAVHIREGSSTRCGSGRHDIHGWISVPVSDVTGDNLCCNCAKKPSNPEQYYNARRGYIESESFARSLLPKR